MRPFIFALLLCCGVSSACTAAEKPVSSEELRAFQGNYDLSDGGLLTVSQRNRKLFVQINNGPTIEIVATRAAQFVAISGSLRIEFDQYPNGSVTGVRLVR